MNIHVVYTCLILFGALNPLLSAATTAFTSEKQLIEKLSSHTAEEIKGDIARAKKEEPLKTIEIFDDVDAAVTYYGRNKLTKEGATQIQRTCLLTFLLDDTYFCIEQTIKLYNQNKTTFRSTKNNFHPHDWRLISKLYKNYSREAQD